MWDAVSNIFSQCTLAENSRKQLKNFLPEKQWNQCELCDCAFCVFTLTKHSNNNFYRFPEDQLWEINYHRPMYVSKITTLEKVSL
ncbi:hypothetical protein Lepto7375DRAFT_1380 [Leptolyngbya sp. PCC 7375]|nr:hypothetical protein Lepto7375DRAFT_1380 [Leptolyngbya sp. PCC 7375]